MKERTDLLIIDPQVDFCDKDKGALYVPGAEKDMERVANFIDKIGKDIDNIHVTLDCHHLYDIAHPGFWRNSEGKNPPIFEIITYENIVNGKWFPVFQKLPLIDPETGKNYEARKYVKEYTKKLEESGRYPLCVWPPHCLIGTKGNTIIPVLAEALQKWEILKRNNINYVSKGSNILTEHYSAVKAEVPDPTDPSTQLNTPLIETFKLVTRLYFAGEAGSHCLKSTGEDIADGFKDDTYIQKMILLTDGVSPVISPFVDFPAIQAQFITDMKARGMKTALTTDF